ncbi:MAG: DUF2141 domain-containing protein [Ignavibacteriales bacterium]|nr:DUF2141 domain-containing protein [Ignavibacteriales bacterium]MCB9259921.1 DUF2141 domain-containing protein [Ignavibacteriales bacterium]
MNYKIILVFAFIFTLKICGQNCKLTVKVYNLEKRKGNISIGLFNKPVGFPKKDSGSIGIEIPIKDSFVEHTFLNLEYGKYALAIYNDENKNGKLDRSIFGWPIEDYVFSNYAKGSFAPPSFEDASFQLRDSVLIELEFK